MKGNRRQPMLPNQRHAAHRMLTAILLLVVALPAAATPQLDLHESPNFTPAPPIGPSDRTTGAFRIPLNASMRLGDKTGWELEVTKPSTIGLYDFKFDDISLPNLPDQVETVGRLPGLHLHLPASEQWILTPFVDIGTGKARDGKQVAWIYSTGMESRYAFDWGNHDLLLGNRVRYSGYALDDNSQSDRFLSFETQLDIHLPKQSNIFGWNADLNIYGLNQLYINGSEFTSLQQEKQEITALWETGLSVDLSNGGKSGFSGLPRIGLGYHFGEGVSMFRLVLDKEF